MVQSLLKSSALIQEKLETKSLIFNFVVSILRSIEDFGSWLVESLESEREKGKVQGDNDLFCKQELLHIRES